MDVFLQGIVEQRNKYKQWKFRSKQSRVKFELAEDLSMWEAHLNKEPPFYPEINQQWREREKKRRSSQGISSIAAGYRNGQSIGTQDAKFFVPVHLTALGTESTITN